MKWSELRRIALANGWYLACRGSKHDLYRHPGRPDVMVLERHDTEEVRQGLQHKLLKQIAKSE